MTARLLPPAPASLTRGLADLPAALDRAQPLRQKHRAQLPSQVAQLSEWLTTDRDELPRDYLSRPAVLSAYLHYFLPWNLYRQGRLAAGLDLQFKAGQRIVDVGAGPLTFALALWLTRPDLRELPLEILAIDRSAAALQAGRRVWDAVAPDAPWRVELLAQPAGGRALPEADLMVLANVLNEVHRPGGNDSESEDDPTDRLLERWAGSLAPGGRVLVIEPGTRPAARALVMLRAHALECGWRLLAPCPHGERCPQPGTGRHPWCHFAFDAAGSPAWLEDLSRRAGLTKDRASLSFLLLQPGVAAGPAAPAGREDEVLGVSGAFPLPEQARGRYGCAARGLVLLEEKSPSANVGPQPGDSVTVAWPDTPRRDGRSGALIAPLPVPAGGAARGSGPAPGGNGPRRPAPRKLSRGSGR